MQATLPDNELSLLTLDDIIFYRLSPNDLPVNPAKEWPGVVTAIYSSLRFVVVRVLTEGFVGEEDEVSFGQIIRMEKPHAQNSRN